MVYHGPSSGCKACKTRRVKCDQSKPACANCTRRGQTCPGYADVFDGAHRSQNNVVVRRAERKNAAAAAAAATTNLVSGNVNAGSQSPAETIVSTPSNAPTPSAATAVTNKRPLHWVIYSASVGGTSTDRNDTHLLAERESPLSSSSSTSSSPSTAVELHARQSQFLIPPSPKQDPADASIAFFFRHYMSSHHDPDTNGGFSLMWPPLFARSSIDSPLRAVTTAFTVNIAMMWCLKGCDTRPAQKLLTKALSATRKAIQEPTPQKLDELLMTVLIFDLYDSLLLHYLPGPATTSGKHKAGALALIRHRGPSNFDSVLSRGLGDAARHTLILSALASRTRLPEASEILYHPALCYNPISRLDVIAVQMVDVQARLWSVRRRRRQKGLSFDEHLQTYRDIVDEAVRVDHLLLEWKRTIDADADGRWIPHRVHRDDVAPSIRVAGFYGDTCTVWGDMIFGELVNLYSHRRLMNLQVIRQALTDEPALQTNNYLLSQTDSAAQSCVDTICDSVPSHLGDTVVATNPIYSEEINFPLATTTDSTGKEVVIPHDLPAYKIRAAASGGWALFPYVVGILRMAEPEDDAVPLGLRAGQADWIKAQNKRLQTIFLYCDPVWFKRIPPNAADIVDTTVYTNE